MAVGVLAHSLLVAARGPEMGSAPAENVAKTMEISTFTKIMLLWLQFGGPPMHAAAATATLFSQTLIEHLKH